MEVTHPSENTFQIRSGDHVLELTQEEYEDIFHALPLDPSALYMLLNETLLDTGEEREQLQAIVDREGGVDESMTRLAGLIDEFAPDRDVDQNESGGATDEEGDVDDWDDFEEELDRELPGTSDDSDFSGSPSDQT